MLRFHEENIKPKVMLAIQSSRDTITVCVFPKLNIKSKSLAYTFNDWLSSTHPKSQNPVNHNIYIILITEWTWLTRVEVIFFKIRSFAFSSVVWHHYLASACELNPDKFPFVFALRSVTVIRTSSEINTLFCTLYPSRPTSVLNLL